MYNYNRSPEEQAVYNRRVMNGADYILERMFGIRPNRGTKPAIVFDDDDHFEDEEEELED